MPIDALLTREPGIGAIEEELHGGLSDSRVYRVSNGGQSRVLKIQRDPREIEFLTSLAPRILRNASWLPRVFDAGTVDEWNWLLLEFIPTQLPRERWSHDPQALEILRQLHDTVVDPTAFDWAENRWTEEQLEVSSRYLPDGTNRLLRRVHGMYQELADRDIVLCSGDPNAPNWLVRDSGELVLIDWQIVTRANRALDIAGWIATMLDYTHIQQVAARYRGTADLDEPTRELARATAIFFCRRCATNFWRAATSPHPDRWQPGIDRLIGVLPGWLDTLARDARL